jgi:phage major head subunit gpT-like protein
MPSKPLYLTADCPLEIQAADGTKTPTVRGVVYSGGAMWLSCWGNVAVDLRGATIANPVPILAGHRDDLDSVCGDAEAAIVSGTIVVSGRLSAATAAGAKVIGLAKDKVGMQASIGFEPDQREQLGAGQVAQINGRTLTAGRDGLTIIRSGRLREISLVAVGADAGNAIQISASAKEKPMSTDNANVNASPEQLERVEAHWNRAGGTPWYTDSDSYRGGDCPFARAQKAYLAASHGLMTQTEFEAKLYFEKNNDSELRTLHASLPKGPGIRSSSVDSQGDVLQCAFARGIGVRRETVEKSFAPSVLEATDRQYRGGIGLQELLLAAASMSGYDGRAKITAGNLGEVLRAGWSTMQVSGILSNTANKYILDEYNAIEQSWREIASIVPVSNFKTATWYRLNADAVYEEVGPAGEITHGTATEDSYTNRAKTFGKMFGITRQNIIDDDAGAFDQMRRIIGRGAALKLNSVFWTAFLDNASFFTAGRGNYDDGAETALSLTSLGAMTTLFRQQADADGQPLGVSPALLLVPVELEALAKQYYVSTELRDTTASTQYPTGNIYHATYKPVASSYLSNSSFTGYSAKAWYLLADPRNLATMQVCFLDGNQNPTVESADADFHTLGIQFRGYHDFGCAQAEYRAGVKAKGEA